MFSPPLLPAPSPHYHVFTRHQGTQQLYHAGTVAPSLYSIPGAKDLMFRHLNCKFPLAQLETYQTPIWMFIWTSTYKISSCRTSPGLYAERLLRRNWCISLRGSKCITVHLDKGPIDRLWHVNWDLPFGRSKILVMGRTFRPSKITLLHCKFGRQ